MSRRADTSEVSISLAAGRVKDDLNASDEFYAGQPVPQHNGRDVECVMRSIESSHDAKPFASSLSSQWLDVGDRFRVAMADARHNHTCVVYDAQEHWVYRCQADTARQHFDELARMRDTSRQLSGSTSTSAGRQVR